MNRSMRALALGLATTTPAIALAQETVELEEIVVSGGLTPVPVEEYGRAFTVITAEDLERRQTVYLADALRGVPGVSINRTGGFGGLTFARIRGGESNHTLVLIDGVEANAAEGGDFDFGGLLAADIERVEILRGPQSALYGSNALGGVIAITTKQARADGVSWGGSAEGGSDGTFGGDIHLRARNEDVALSLSAAGRRTGGFDISGGPNGEDDRDENITFNARLTGFVSESVRVGGSLRLTDRDSDTDGFLFGAADRDGLVFEEDSVQERTELFGSLFAEVDTLGGRLAHKAELTYLYADSAFVTDGAALSDTTGTRFGFDWRSTLAIDTGSVDTADHLVTIAADYQRETFENDDPTILFDPSQLAQQSRNLFGIAGEYRGTFFDRVDLQAGVRHDFNDDFEDATTFSVGLAYRLEETGTRFHGSVGSGVVNPTFFEQFGFIPDQFVGNPDLKPEKSFGWDIGVEQTFWDGRAVVDVTYFDQDLEDEIFTVFPPPDFISTVLNDPGESQRRGVEIAATVMPLDGLSLGVSYTYLDAEDFDGTQEVRRPRHEGSVVATYSFLGGRASITGDARFVADAVDSDFRSPAFGSSKVALDNYVLLNIAGSYKLNDQVELVARVNNLADTEYEEVFGYDTQGITGFAGVRVSF
ncbi:MAG: TonB-dependent receptor [Pseudomonadota bacterium]